ncbi:unnamed protein product, partial [Eretmochelys imbricata]
NKYEVTEDGWIIYGDKQYFFSTESVPLEKAREFCKKHCADLVVTVKESFYGNTWMDGSPVHYVAWAKNEPDYANAEENCLWNDINCGIPNAFICETHGSTVNSTFAVTAPSPPGGCPESWLLFRNK